MNQITEKDLIFYTSEIECLGSIISEYAQNEEFEKLIGALAEFRELLDNYKKVFEEYKKSKVINAQIILKSQEFSDHAEAVLQNCHYFLQRNLNLLH